MKKEKWWIRVLKIIGFTGLRMVIGNQKGVKGTDNVGKINDVIEELKESV